MITNGDDLTKAIERVTMLRALRRRLEGRATLEPQVRYALADVNRWLDDLSREIGRYAEAQQWDDPSDSDGGG